MMLSLDEVADMLVSGMRRQLLEIGDALESDIRSQVALAWPAACEGTPASPLTFVPAGSTLLH